MGSRNAITTAALGKYPTPCSQLDIQPAPSPERISSSLKQDIPNIRVGPPLQFEPGPQIFPAFAGTRKKAIPSFIPCRLTISVDGIGPTTKRFVHKEAFFVGWNEGESFQQCDRIAENFVKREVSGLGGGWAWYRGSPHYLILQQIHQTAKANWLEQMTRAGWGSDVSDAPEITLWCESIKNTDSGKNINEWEEKVSLAVAKQLHDNRDSTLLLELEYFYTLFKPHQVCECVKTQCSLDIRTYLLDNMVELLIPGEAEDKPDETEVEGNYIPGRFLDHFFSRELVEHLVSQVTSLQTSPEFESDRDDFVDHVHAFCIRLLASCLLAGIDLKYLYQMWKKSDHKLYDADIPLKQKDKPKGVDKLVFNSFLQYQGWLRAHNFSNPTNRKHQVIHKGIVVPVLKEKKIGSGLNGPVYQVKIHEEHHAFHPNRNQRFALKTITKPAPNQNIEHEREILTTLNKIPHPHITPLVASWSQGLFCMILLPLAKQNLHDFLRETSPPVLDESFVIWLFTQITGLAEAVDHIHHSGPAKVSPATIEQKQSGEGSAGYHHDLKPKNILLFADGVLKISDFGTARLQQLISAGGSHKTSPLCDADYSAPENELAGEASRPHDVFALGCIWLEMLVWAFEPKGGVEKFYQERNPKSKDLSPQGQHTGTARFWYRNDGGKAFLKDAVEHKLNGLSKFRGFQGVFTGLAKLVRKMLKCDPEKRPKISEVRSIVEKMIREAQLNFIDHGLDYFKSNSNVRSKPTFAAPSTAASDLADNRSSTGSIDQRAHRPSIASLDLPPTMGRRFSTGNAPSSPTHLAPLLPAHRTAGLTVRAGGQFADAVQFVPSDGDRGLQGEPATPPRYLTPHFISVVDCDENMSPEQSATPREPPSLIWSPILPESPSPFRPNECTRIEKDGG